MRAMREMRAKNPIIFKDIPEDDNELNAMEYVMEEESEYDEDEPLEDEEEEDADYEDVEYLCVICNMNINATKENYVQICFYHFKSTFQ